MNMNGIFLPYPSCGVNILAKHTSELLLNKILTGFFVAYGIVFL